MLGQNFFARPTLTVARALLGQQLVRELDGQRLSGLIVETEAYIGPDDSACHAYKGRYSDRTQVMFGPPGRTYVYLIYGMYYMLNLVTEAENFPAAVLIRAIEPLTGVDLMRTHRQRVQRPTMKQTNLANGPGKLCQALKIDKTLNNWDVTQARKLWLEPGDTVSNTAIANGPRIGINYARPEDRVAPWRFWIRNNRFVSK